MARMSFGEYLQAVMAALCNEFSYDDPYALLTPFEQETRSTRVIDNIFAAWFKNKSVAAAAKRIDDVWCDEAETDDFSPPGTIHIAQYILERNGIELDDKVTTVAKSIAENGVAHALPYMARVIEAAVNKIESCGEVDIPDTNKEPSKESTDARTNEGDSQQPG